jgi:hypothetical protein
MGDTIGSMESTGDVSTEAVVDTGINAVEAADDAVSSEVGANTTDATDPALAVDGIGKTVDAAIAQASDRPDAVSEGFVLDSALLHRLRALDAVCSVFYQGKIFKIEFSNLGAIIHVGLKSGQGKDEKNEGGYAYHLSRLEHLEGNHFTRITPGGNVSAMTEDERNEFVAFLNGYRIRQVKPALYDGKRGRD